MLEELAEDNTGTVKFGKLDVATSIQTAMKYGVMGVPTVMVFKNGEPAGGILRGLQGKAKYQEVIDSVKA